MKYSEIDYKQANAQLNSVLFDVQLVNLVTSAVGLFQDILIDKIQVKGYNAVVNVKNKEVLCVVSSQYHLITNREALELGKKAFVKLFPSVKESDLIPYKVISSSRKTYCHIDLIHNKVNFNVWEQDTWLPFIRITNSYNRTHKLSFELGFVRKLCWNGVIFDKKTVKVKYTHSKGQIPTEIIADISKLKTLEADFISQLINLRRFHIAPKLVFPLVCKSLKLYWNFEEDNPALHKTLDQYHDLKNLSKKLAESYIEKEGQNAYAALNVITDIVSHQDLYKNLPFFTIRINEYYHRISDWMREFTDSAEKRDFEIGKYLEEFADHID